MSIMSQSTCPLLGLHGSLQPLQHNSTCFCTAVTTRMHVLQQRPNLPHRPNKRWRGGDRAPMDTYEPHIFSPHTIGARLTCQLNILSPQQTAHDVRNVTVDHSPPNFRTLSCRACRGSGVVADMVCVWDLIHHIFVVSAPLARLMHSSHSFS